jgi:hypothetical protein
MLRLAVEFIHVCAAMGIFGAAAIEGASVLELNRAGASPTALQGFGLARRLGSISFALILLTGIFLTQTVWGWQIAWISVSMSSIVVMVAIGATVTRRAMARLRGPAPDAAGAYDALVWSFLTRVGILIGIVFLMTVKPPLKESLIAVAAATGAGFLAGLPSGRRRATRATSQG